MHSIKSLKKSKLNCHRLFFFHFTMEDDDAYESDFEAKFRPKVYNCNIKTAIMRRVKNLDDVENHFVQDYYLAFNMIMCKFEVNYLKMNDLNFIASEAEYVLPMLRARACRIRTRTESLCELAETRSIGLLALFVKIDTSNRTKEYVKRLMIEIRAHIIALFFDERCFSLYTLTDYVLIRMSLKRLTTHLNEIIAFHHITKKVWQ